MRLASAKMRPASSSRRKRATRSMFVATQRTLTGPAEEAADCGLEVAALPLGDVLEERLCLRESRG